MNRLIAPVLIALGLTALPGCGAGVAVVYDGARNASERVIGQTLAETDPGIDPDRGAACIIAAMTYREVLALGTSDSTEVTPAYRAAVAEVRQRDGVADCLAAATAAGA